MVRERTIAANDNKWQRANAAIKPSATAVVHRRCKRRQLKMGACSQIFNFAFWGIYAATDIAEAEQGRSPKVSQWQKFGNLKNLFYICSRNQAVMGVALRVQTECRRR